MARRHLSANVISPELVEFGATPDPPESLQLARNGEPLEPGRDYQLGEGDLANFAQRRAGEPWSQTDHFTASYEPA